VVGIGLKFDYRRGHDEAKKALFVAPFFPDRILETNISVWHSLC